VHLESLQGQAAVLWDGQLEYRLDLWEPPQDPGCPVRDDGVTVEAARHEGLLKCLGGSEAPIDAGVHLPPVVTAGEVAPLTGRHACSQRLPTRDQSMLCGDQTI
jgi:hypothetical protein